MSKRTDAMKRKAQRNLKKAKVQLAKFQAKEGWTVYALHPKPAQSAKA